LIPSPLPPLLCELFLLCALFLLGELCALPSVTSAFSFFLLFAFLFALLLCELCASALNLFKSPPLKFRRAQHQSRHHSHIHALHRIVQLRLHNLWILNLLFQSLHGSARRFSAEQHSHGTIQRHLRIRRRVHTH